MSGMQSDALYLLDGYSLIYRSYFAMIRRPLRNPQGQNSSAIFGFFRSLYSFLDQYEPKQLVVVLDSIGPTFRHEQFEEYKATRDKTPEELTAQIPVIEEIIDVLGVPKHRAEGFEADDVIATLAERCRSEGRPCYILSGDKDLLQLVGGPVRMLKPEGSGSFVRLDADAVRERWGIGPGQIRDYLSLVGDASDNVPGVSGIGDKTAAQLLSQFDSLEGIYNRIEEVPGASKQKKLLEGKEAAYMSRELVKLRTDAPVLAEDKCVLPALRFRDAVPYFQQQGMRSLAEDSLARGGGGDEATGAEGEATSGKPVGEAGKPGPSADGRKTRPAGDAGKTEPVVDQSATTASALGFDAALAPDEETVREAERLGRLSPEYVCVRGTEELEEWIERCRQAGRFSFDAETDALDAMVASPVGLSLAAEPGRACYIPLRGPDGPVLDDELVRDRLARLFDSREVEVVGQNLQYDYKVLSRWGMPVRARCFDTLVAAWLLDAEAGQYGLDRLAERYLGYTTLHYDDVVPKAKRGEARRTFDSVPLETATRYAAEDADLALRLADLFVLLLEKRGLSGIAAGVEMPLVPVLAEMELAGIRVDLDELSRYGGELVEEMGRIEESVYAEVGRRFNLNSTQQLQTVLFEERGLAPRRKTKTGYSTDTAVLEELAAEDVVPELVLRHRRLSKLKSTYVDALPRMVNEDTGRIHTSFQVTGTATGRLSSRDPNLQNIPIKDEEGRRIRRAFVPAPGHWFVSADYSQIELVVLGHLSGDEGLRRAFAEGQDVHRATGALIFGVEPDQVTPEQRRIAKTINFGVMYGMSAFRLSRELRIQRREAERFIEAYFRTYSKIRDFVDQKVREAQEHGYVNTLFGRQRPLPAINSRNRAEKQGAERIAVNTPIQGTAADIVKQAMLRVERRLKEDGLRSSLLLQVHDELMLECPEDEVEQVKRVLHEEMTSAVELSIPLKVSVEAGLNWGELH